MVNRWEPNSTKPKRQEISARAKITFLLNNFSLEGNLSRKSCQDKKVILDGPQLPQTRRRIRLEREKERWWEIEISNKTWYVDDTKNRSSIVKFQTHRSLSKEKIWPWRRGRKFSQPIRHKLRTTFSTWNP